MITRYITVKDFEQLAETFMTENAKNYINSGSNHQGALKSNEDMFRMVKVNPRVLVDVSRTCTKARFLGKPTKIPIGISPTAMHKLVHPLGEINTVKAAQSWETIMTLSTLTTTSIPDVARAGRDCRKVYQLYITKNREITKALVKMAEEEGFEALALTIDAPVLGKREADNRNNFNLPPGLRLEALEALGGTMNSSKTSGLLQLFADQSDQALSWKTLEWLKSITKLPIILKGIQSAEDAEQAGKFLLKISKKRF